MFFQGGEIGNHKRAAALPLDHAVATVRLADKAVSGIASRDERLPQLIELRSLQALNEVFFKKFRSGLRRMDAGAQKALTSF